MAKKIHVIEENLIENGDFENDLSEWYEPLSPPRFEWTPDGAAYTGWDIVTKDNFDPENPTTWFIDEGNDYPRLWFEYGSGEEPEVPSRAKKKINGVFQEVTDKLKIGGVYVTPTIKVKQEGVFI